MPAVGTHPFVTRDILRSELDRSERRLIKWMFGIVLGSLAATTALAMAAISLIESPQLP